MATASIHSGNVRRRSVLQTLLLTAFGAILLVGLLLFVGFLWFHHEALASLPQVDGEISGLGLWQPVTVTRDIHGVPHIRAASMRDLLFAQGFVTAQDRLWQMDMSRRFGRGELSEVLGPDFLKLDIRQRTLQLREAAEHNAAAQSSEQRELMQDYADGVNALIARQTSLPIEFRVLHYAPRPWTVVDSLMVGVNISQSLNTQYPMEHEREKLISRLTPKEIADLYPNSSWRDHPPTEAPADAAGPSSNEKASERGVFQIQAQPEQNSPEQTLLQQFRPSHTAIILEALRTIGALQSASGRRSCDACDPGSNNWVVSGAHTVTGKPLLSNDMHMDHSIPSVWYEIQLQTDGLDAAGVSFPGLPFVVAGHNQRIAWGFTNVGPDVQDMFVEKFNAAGQYATPNGWQTPEHRNEVIHIKGRPDVQLEVELTRHGPIISGLFPGESRKLALKWTLYDPAAMQVAFYDIDRARDWPSFLAAISHFGGAAQNIVYADVDGNIGYHAAGSIPIRASGDGLLPVPGEDDAHEWTGYIPFGQLPNVFNPPTGIIATANGRITPDGYKYLIANEWGSPYRTERIYRLLSADKKFSSADMLAIQMDAHSEFSRLCANAFVYGVDHSTKATARAREAADIMRGFDGDMSIQSVAATLSVEARNQLWQLLLEPKLGTEWKQYTWFNQGTALERLLTQEPADWLPAGYSNWNDLLVEAVNRAVAKGPTNLRSWKWGDVNPVEIEHPLFGKVPILKRWAGTGVKPQAGDGSYTIRAAGRAFGASEHETLDLANLDNTTLNLVIGESGQIFSKHFMDHWKAWYEGWSFALPFSDAAVKSMAEHTLVLH